MASLSTPEDQKHFERSTEEVATSISSPVFILSSHRAVTSATPPSGLLQRRCNASVQSLFRTAFCSAVDSHCPLFRRASAAVLPYFCHCSAPVPPRSSRRHPASVQPCSVACSTFCSAAVPPLFSLHSAAVQPPSSFKVPAPSPSSVDFQKSLRADEAFQ
ncbi:hypothetical protein S245_027337 [Arachis hypogaea]